MTPAEMADALERFEEFHMARSRLVANWLECRFTESPEWVAVELDCLAKANGFLLELWWDSPAVQALGIRKELRTDEATGQSHWWWIRDQETKG